MSKKLLSVGVLLTLIAAVLVGGATVVSADAATCSLVSTLAAAGFIPADKLATAQAAAGCGVSAPAACSSFTRNLTVGSTGADVTALQTKLGVTPATGYFGAITKAAVVAYQTANGIAPAAGYVGPITLAKLNYCAPVIVTPGTPSTPNTPSTGLGGGEASLEKFDISSGDDSEVEEDSSGEVAEIEFDVEDGDVMINRVDLKFANASTTDTTDPWDALESVQLIIDGKEVGSADLSDEDEYLDENDGTVRISNINYKVVEGKTVTIVIEVTAQDNIDTDDRDTFEVSVLDDGIRATDGEGLTQEIGSDAEAIDFDIEVAGADEELNLKTSSANPDALTILVDENDESDWEEVFIFRIEAEGGDIDLEDLVLSVETGSEDYEVVVADVKIEIAGEVFDDVEIVGAASTTAELTFDIDGDFTIDEDKTVEVVVFMKFESTEDNASYLSGSETVQVSTVSVSGEGADDESDTATVSSEVHTLSASPAVVSAISWDTTETDSAGIIDFFFTVKAEEDDFDVLTAQVLDEVTGATFGAGTEPDTANQGSLSRVSGDSVTAIAADAGFKVAEGDTTRFRVRYTASGAGTYEVRITSVAGQAVDDEDQISPTLLLEDAI